MFGVRACYNEYVESRRARPMTINQSHFRVPIYVGHNLELRVALFGRSR